MRVPSTKLFRMEFSKNLIQITHALITLVEMVRLLISLQIIKNANSPPTVGMVFDRFLHSAAPVFPSAAIPTFLYWVHSANFLPSIPESPASNRNATNFGLYVSISTYVQSANSPKLSFCGSPSISAPSHGVGFFFSNQLPSMYPHSV